MLSALLDNAPTYLAFFAAALGLHHFAINDPLQVADFISKNGSELTALSLGAAFFGALTYIGNAPNLLVKTIAEHAHVPTPSFIGYIWQIRSPSLDSDLCTGVDFVFLSVAQRNCRGSNCPLMFF